MTQTFCPASAVRSFWRVCGARLSAALLFAVAGSEGMLPLILSAIRSKKGKNVADSMRRRIGDVHLVIPFQSQYFRRRITGLIIFVRGP
jgi:hypothetical protein